MKIRQVQIELFHVDGRKDTQTDTKKLSVAIRKFSNPFRKEFFCNTFCSKCNYFLTVVFAVSVIKTVHFYGKFVALYCENHIEFISTLYEMYSVLMLKLALYNVASRR